VNGIVNNLRNKILLFNILIVLPLSLTVYFYLPWCFKALTIKEKGKILSQLHEHATLYLDHSTYDTPMISPIAGQQEKITIEEASSISEITATVEELNNSSQQISGKAEQVAKRSQDVLKTVIDGQHSVHKSIEEFNTIREKVNVIAEHILTLSREAGNLQSLSLELQEIIKSSKA